MTRTRARADERNEKTDSVTKERRRIRNLEEENAKLKEWLAVFQDHEEEKSEDRERLRDLLEHMADHLDANGGRLDWGEGLQHRTITTEDLLRIAKLLEDVELRY